MGDLILPVVQILTVLLLAYLAARAYYTRLPSKPSEPWSYVNCTATDTKYTYRESQGGWLPTDPRALRRLPALDGTLRTRPQTHQRRPEMSDIVEQAARVACPNGPDHDHQPNLDQGCNWALQLCQTLADAGLLAEPARTVPTRGEIATAIMQADRAPHTDYTPQADAVLALMNGQPTVAEAKAQALEEFAEVWATGEWSDWFLAENVTCDVSAVQATDKALRERAQEIREDQ